MKLRMVQMFFNAYKEERNLLHWVMKESSFLGLVNLKLEE